MLLLLFLLGQKVLYQTLWNFHYKYIKRWFEVCCIRSLQPWSTVGDQRANFFQKFSVVNYFQRSNFIVQQVVQYLLMWEKNVISFWMILNERINVNHHLSCVWSNLIRLCQLDQKVNTPFWVQIDHKKGDFRPSLVAKLNERVKAFFQDLECSWSVNLVEISVPSMSRKPGACV